jgi:hypothetical protein
LGVPAPIDTSRVSGYDYGAPLPSGGWNGNGQSYGWSKHLGVDYGTKPGSAIVAPFGGTTKFEQGVIGYGNKLTLTLANGFKFIFGHVSQGTNGPVTAGMRIGTTGQNVGSAQGSVTLIEVRDPNGVAVNPHTYLDSIFAGTASATRLFGAASGQLLAQPPSSEGTSGASGGTSGPNLGAAWDTLIKDLQAFPSEASRNTAAQVGALGQAANQVTSAFKPVGDFFGTVQKLIEPKHLWTGFFVGTGVVMVLVGLLIYFKGDDMVAGARTVSVDAAKVAAT